MDEWQQRQYEPPREFQSEWQRTLEQRQCEFDAHLLQKQEEYLQEQRRQEVLQDRADHDVQERIEQRWQWRRWLGWDRRDAPAGRPEPRKPGSRQPGGRRR